MSLGNHAITNPKQLAGKTVVTAGIPYQTAYLHTILERAGVDPGSVKEVNVGFNLTAGCFAISGVCIGGAAGGPALRQDRGHGLDRRCRRPRAARASRESARRSRGAHTAVLRCPVRPILRETAGRAWSRC